MKFRNRFFYAILRPLVILFLKTKFKFKYKKLRRINGNYLILSNHTTDFDPLFVASSCPRRTSFVASEHITRFKAYKLLDYAVSPIIRYKGTSGATTTKEVLSRLRKGANVCIFPEGVRTFDGVTCPISYSTAKLVKTCGASLVTYKIQGGYLASPMWSKAKDSRKGLITGAPVNIYNKETLKTMSVDEIYNAIITDLYEDAYQTQAQKPIKYKGKNKAKGLETFMFVCPKCKAHASFSTDKNTVKCTNCDHTFTYDEYGYLNGTDFKTLTEFSIWQKEQVELDAKNGLNYTANSASLSVIVNHQATSTVQGKLTITNETLTCGEVSIPISDIPDMAIHGKYSLCFSFDMHYYELSLPKGDNAYRFLLAFNQAKLLKLAPAPELVPAQ